MKLILSGYARAKSQSRVELAQLVARFGPAGDHVPDVEGPTVLDLKLLFGGQGSRPRELSG
jgi:hypothetical protein